MPRRCAALHCTNRSQKGSCISFHRFPFRKPDLLESWLENIRRKGWKPSKYSHICSDHFDDDCYKFVGCHHERRLLKRTAVPTKFKFTDKECEEFQSANVSRQYPTCLVPANVLETSDGLAKSPTKCNASPVENGNTIHQENYSGVNCPNNTCSLVESSINGTYKVPGTESDTFSEVSLSDDDLAEQPLNGSFEEQDIEDDSDDSSNSIQYLATLSVEEIFKAQEVILISSDSEHSENPLSENEFSDVSYEPQSLPCRQKESPSPEGRKWTVSWSDTVFLEDFVDSQKLPLSALSPKKSNVKTKKVVYYGEQKNHHAKLMRLNKLILENNAIVKDAHPVNIKQEITETSSWTENATTNSATPKHIDIANRNIIEEKIKSDKVVPVQELRNTKHNISATNCHSNGIPTLNNAIKDPAANIISQLHNISAKHQLNTDNSFSILKEGKRTNVINYPINSSVINGHNNSLSESPPNATPKEEKHTNALNCPSSSAAISGRNDDVSKSEKEYYDEIISKKDKQLSILRKRLKTYKKQLAQRNRTISVLNAELVNLDFMNPYR